MQSNDAPDVIQIPFANTGAKRVIPIPSQISITPGAASYTDGFPPTTMTPLADGGIPPDGLDMNGALYDVTNIQRWQSAGGMFKYDAAFSTANGGYPKGARLISTNGYTEWINTVENNVTDPDGVGAAGWFAFTEAEGAGAIGIEPIVGLTATNVQDAIEEVSAIIPDLALPSGSSGVGYEPFAPDAEDTQVEDRLREFDAAVPFACIPNVGTVANRNETVIGDSIGQGAFALNSFMHAWARVFQRCWNADAGSTSYGFVNLLTLGSGPTTTTEVHAVNFTGTAWTGIDSASNANAENYPCGLAMRAGDATSTITITVPSFQSRAVIYFGTRVGSANFTVSLNGGAATSVPTNAAAGYDTFELAMVDNGYGDNVIVIQSTAGATQPDIIGIAYLSSSLEPVFNNFSNSGRRLRYVGQDLIIKLMQESASMVVALGHNDQGDADSDNTYYAAFMQRITWLTTYALQYGVRMIVPDFCWTAAPSSRTRKALRQLAADTGGTYIDLPGMLFKNRESITPGTNRGNYLVSTLKMWTDPSHPGKSGHQWVAETIAKVRGMSCTSKAVAISLHDWWMPMALKVATAAYNVFTTTNVVSSYKRSGSQLLVRVYVHKSALAAFPAGDNQIQDAWRAISELQPFQGMTGVSSVRATTGATGATVSVFEVSAGGTLNLKVLDGTWTNDQNFVFSLPMQF